MPKVSCAFGGGAQHAIGGVCTIRGAGGVKQ